MYSYVSYEHNIIQCLSFRNFNEMNFKHERDNLYSEAVI